MIEGRVAIAVRKATSADADGLVSVFRAAWQLAYSGLIPSLHLARLLARRDCAWWRNAIRTERHLIVLEVAGTVVGYATCGKSRGLNPKSGEIYELYLEPVYQGIGLGEHLFEACRDRLDRDRLNGLIVWALADNTEARDFYWRRGGRPCARSTERFSGKVLEKIAYDWP